jgi:preprotein translocase subunit SecG
MRLSPPASEYRRLAVVLFGAWWLSHLLNLIILGVGCLLMLIILIQRGKGGGLAGAFGGAGGSSPFGSRTADQFVKITLWLAGVWVLLIMIHVKIVKYDIRSDAERSLTTTGAPQ